MKDLKQTLFITAGRYQHTNACKSVQVQLGLSDQFTGACHEGLSPSQMVTCQYCYIGGYLGYPFKAA